MSSQRSNDQCSAAIAYDRARDLPRLIRLWPAEAVALAAKDHPRLLLLAQALRAERRRGLARAWSYDLVRHRALLRAYRAELVLAPAAKAGKPARLILPDRRRSVTTGAMDQPFLPNTPAKMFPNEIEP